MTLEERINKDYIEAMKARDTAKSSALSYLRAMIKQVKVDQRLEILDDNGVVTVLKKQIKQRQDSIEQFEKGGRADLAAREKAEVELMKPYLPAEMPEEEVAAIIAQAVKDIGAASMKDMGALMKVVRDKVGNRADGKRVSELVREKLASL